MSKAELAQTAADVLNAYAGDAGRLPEELGRSAAEQEVAQAQAALKEQQTVLDGLNQQLNELIASDDTEREIVLRAQRQLLETLSNQEKETTIEGVLRMRGYSGAVATVHEDSVNVLVRAESLSQSETAVILELVLREAGISGGNVKIIPII